MGLAKLQTCFVSPPLLCSFCCQLLLMPLARMLLSRHLIRYNFRRFGCPCGIGCYHRFLGGYSSRLLLQLGWYNGLRSNCYWSNCPGKWLLVSKGGFTRIWHDL